MSINDLMFAIEDIFMALFKILEWLGNAPNVLIVIVMFAMTFWWLMWQASFNKKADEKGTLR